MNPIIPGAREAGSPVRFAKAAAGPPRYAAWSSTMDAATIADRQREGGGGPSQRPRVGEPSGWKAFLKKFVMKGPR